MSGTSHAAPGSLHAQHAQHALSPSIYWQTCASSSHVEFSALAQGCAGRQPQSYTPSPKHCQLSDLPEICARRAASATDMGMLWCGAACDAIFSPVFHAGASRHSTVLTRRAQQAANMVISQFCRRCAGAAHLGEKMRANVRAWVERMKA